MSMTPPTTSPGDLADSRRGDTVVCTKARDRELMNCSDCRTRKIKCDRQRPSCKACQLFHRPCIYDALPKKRGRKANSGKTTLLNNKRVEKSSSSSASTANANGPKDVVKLESPITSPVHPSSSSSSSPPQLHQQQQQQQQSHHQSQHQQQQQSPASHRRHSNAASDHPPANSPSCLRPILDINIMTSTATAPFVTSPKPRQHSSSSAASCVSPSASFGMGMVGAGYSDVLLDTYFARLHGKPYHILDEQTTRERLQLGQLPNSLLMAVYAVSARYAPCPGGYNASMRLSQEFAARARQGLEFDEPSVEGLQTALLLAIAYFAAGTGRKAYMLFSLAVSMASALDLNREAPPTAPLTAQERETRRNLFWACYVMDRFTACGSKRPSLIADESINLCLPSLAPTDYSSNHPQFLFSLESNLQCLRNGGFHNQHSSSASIILIDIARILGLANRYLEAGGAKGDSHFPWHPLSTLSKIRRDLDVWAAATNSIFSSPAPNSPSPSASMGETLLTHPHSTPLVLSKLVYHTTHCLLLRPFLPLTLDVPPNSSSTGPARDDQTWQLEATTLCFHHANAIVTLVDACLASQPQITQGGGIIVGAATGSFEIPALAGYCLCTAGTVHVHGAHYRVSGQQSDIAAAVADSTAFLGREMRLLSSLRFVWAGIQHQRETLQTVYGAHAEVMKGGKRSSAAGLNVAENDHQQHHHQTQQNGNTMVGVGAGAERGRFLGVLRWEGFFERYPGQIFDGSHVTFLDVTVEAPHQSYVRELAGSSSSSSNQQQQQQQPQQTQTSQTAPTHRSYSFSHPSHLGSSGPQPMQMNEDTQFPIQLMSPLPSPAYQTQLPRQQGHALDMAGTGSINPSHLHPESQCFCYEGGAIEQQVSPGLSFHQLLMMEGADNTTTSGGSEMESMMCDDDTLSLLSPVDCGVGVGGRHFFDGLVGCGSVGSGGLGGNGGCSPDSGIYACFA